MSKSITVKPKRGRPATGRDRLIGVRLPDDMINSLDKWANRNAFTRSEAIRHLVELGLVTASSHRSYSKKSADQAAEIAERQIDRLGDPSATSEERKSRKRKLLKGPAEFRNLRKNPSKR
jgi:Arc/MetJ-type ribon-helix-helix transcriptional regulator